MKTVSKMVPCVIGGETMYKFTDICRFLQLDIRNERRRIAKLKVKPVVVTGKNRGTYMNHKMMAKWFASVPSLKPQDINQPFLFPVYSSVRRTASRRMASLIKNTKSETTKQNKEWRKRINETITSYCFINDKIYRNVWNHMYKKLLHKYTHVDKTKFYKLDKTKKIDYVEKIGMLKQLWDVVVAEVTS